jgi:hypothetical protein
MDTIGLVKRVLKISLYVVVAIAAFLVSMLLGGRTKTPGYALQDNINVAHADAPYAEGGYYVAGSGGSAGEGCGEGSGEGGGEGSGEGGSSSGEGGEGGEGCG